MEIEHAVLFSLTGIFAKKPRLSSKSTRGPTKPAKANFQKKKHLNFLNQHAVIYLSKEFL